MDSNDVLVVVEIRSVHDPEALKAYQTGARQQIAEYGASVIARGGTTLEGAPAFGPLMVQRWPSEAAFRTWQSSENYRPLRAIREASADLRIAVIPLV
ncbi:DUF1330 domain-containing protein [Hydrogenophaga sp.]|jgi:uncharacterized protein (DUF1330 family)|uniref:DUF1330 domain-containing protein n=1 Tax=Hydrogenophaga sp. TaxID=1904254 RepID=UPI003F723C38